MVATASNIRGWFKRGVAEGATHLIVACDTFDDWDNYPVFVMPDQDVHDEEKEVKDVGMQKIDEVYKLDDDMEEQMAEHRCFRY